MIYLDNASTKMVDWKCTRAISDVLFEGWGNPSSLHSYGEKAKRVLNQDRKYIAQFINAQPDEIIFTSGGCESNSLALCGFIKAHPRRVTLITTPIEHKSIALLSADYKATKYIECQELTGIVFMKSLEDILKETVANDTIPLVSIHYANNEIGTIQDIKTITSLVHKYSGIMHTDATQMMCQEKIDVKELGVDMLSFSGQKMGAPKGIGVLYKKSGIDIKPLIYGSQEFGLRGGTENTAYIHALASLVKKDFKYFNNKKTVDYFISKLNQTGIKFMLLGHPKDRLSNHLSICFTDVKDDGTPLVHGESLLYLLDAKGVLVSTGSACNSQSNDSAYVIKSIKVPEKFHYSILRFTFSNHNTKRDVDLVINKLIESMEFLRRL